jgi:hypothetical protein
VFESITASQWLSAGSQVLGAAAARPPQQSRADSGNVYAPFDSSGWIVNTGSGSASGFPFSWWALAGLAAAGLIGYATWKRLTR